MNIGNRDIDAVISKNQYRTKRLYSKFKTPRDVAKWYIRHEYYRGIDLEQLQMGDFHSGCYWYGVEAGPMCAKLGHGKIRGILFNRGDRVFPVRELWDEVVHESKQHALFG